MNISIIKCNDCGSALNTGVVKASSNLLGTYYSGLAICDNCASIRFESAIIEQRKDANPQT